MTPDRSAEEIIAEIERTSRHARPFLIVGLCVLIGSLIASTVYLNLLRNRAEERARTWETTARNLDLTLKKAIRSGDSEETRALLTSAESQTRDLAQMAAAEAADSPSPPAQPSGPILLYIRVSEEEQQLAALALESRLEAAKLGGRTILVPRIAIAATAGPSSLRCFSRADCAYAEKLLQLIAGQMRAPQVRVMDFGGQYRKVPPGTFELWLAPGPVEVG